jgi:hypothetical protein
MPVCDKVNIPDLDECYCRQRFPPSSRLSNAQPAFPVVILKRIEVAVKIVAATLATLDLADWHGSYPGTVVGRSRAAGFDFS